jgi:hypothetical protein
MKPPTLTAHRRTAVLAGVAVILALLVVANRCAGASTPQTIPGPAASTRQAPATTQVWSPAAPPSPSPAATSPAATDNDADPGIDPLAQPHITAGPTDPREAAIGFVAALLNTYGKTPEQWRAGFADKATPQLRDLYATVDPSTVPDVGRIATPVTATVIGDAVVTVTIPATNGATITVTMVGATHRWLAAQVEYTGPAS